MVTVKAKAKVEAESLNLPSGKVSRHSITNEEAQKFAELFLNGRTLCEPERMSKQDIEAQIEKLEGALRGDIELTGDGAGKTPEEIQELLDYYKGELKTAQNEEQKPAELEFKEDDFFRGVIEGQTDGKDNLFIVNYPEYADMALYYKKGYGDKNSDYGENLKYINPDISPEIKLEDAEKQAEKLIEALGLDFSLENSEPVAFADEEHIRVYEPGEEPERVSPDDTGWRLYYVRNVQGQPLKRCGEFGSSVLENEQSGETLCWPYEHIEVCVNADGVVYFNWYSPYNEPEIVTKNSALMEFSDIENIFQKMIMVKNADIKEQNQRNNTTGKIEIEVERVELNLARVRNIGNFGEGQIIPVWDFIGTRRYVPENAGTEAFEEAETEVVLSINAVDGTIIDRRTGV